MEGIAQTAESANARHILVVSNHWQAKKYCPRAGVFVERQIASLKEQAIRISTFDVGLSHSPFVLLKKWIELRRVVRRVKPDIIHARYGTIVAFLSAFAGRPMVVTFCGNDLLPGVSVSVVRLRLGFLLSNVAALRARCLICVSDGLRDALWWRRSRAIVIPDGVDLEMFSPGSQTDARKELGLEEASSIVLFNVGGDPQLKGLELVEAAMQVVYRLVPGAKLCIIPNVEPTRMPLYYRAADVLLCASKNEGSPNVVKEALACNLPVVSVAVGDVPKMLTGVCPSEVVSRDPQVFGEAIANVLKRRQRSNGRETIAALGLKEVAIRVLDVYDSVLRPQC